MTAFQAIADRLSHEQRTKGVERGNLLVGAAIAFSLDDEVKHESHLVRTGHAPRSQEVLLNSALERVETDWIELDKRSDELISTQLPLAQDDRLRNTILNCLDTADSPALSKIWFAVWTGVLANFIWLVATGIIVFGILIAANGWSVPKAFNALMLDDRRPDNAERAH